MNTESSDRNSNNQEVIEFLETKIEKERKVTHTTFSYVAGESISWSVAEKYNPFIELKKNANLDLSIENLEPLKKEIETIEPLVRDKAHKICRWLIRGLKSKESIGRNSEFPLGGFWTMGSPLKDIFVGKSYDRIIYNDVFDCLQYYMINNKEYEVLKESLKERDKKIDIGLERIKKRLLIPSASHGQNQQLLGDKIGSKDLSNDEAWNVAKAFKDQSRNKHTQYSEEEIKYVIDKYIEFSSPSNITEFVRTIQQLEDCPDKVKKNTNKNSEPFRRWINYYKKEYLPIRSEEE